MAANQRLKNIPNKPEDDGIDGDFLEESAAEEQRKVDAGELPGYVDAKDATGKPTKVYTSGKKQRNEKEEVARKVIRVKYPDLVERAKMLLTEHSFNFPETRKVGEVYQVEKDSDANRLEFLRVLFGTGHCPHFSTFKGMVTDAECNPLGIRHKIIPELIDAAREAGLKNQSLNAMSNALQSFALGVRYNDLTIAFMDRLPRWDGTPRLETEMVKRMGTADTESNRTIWKYFMLSLFMRVTQPGCEAPIVICLLGGQDVGKSYFSKRICQEVMSLLGGKEWNSIAPSKLSMASEDKNKFLRAITGNNVVANVPELKGNDRVALNAFKDFATETADSIDHKHRDPVEVPRQWVTTIDGNTYTGLYRDETGERRIYAFFIGEISGSTGDIRWNLDFKADFENFGDAFWQLMAEAKVWVDENGVAGYSKFVRKAVRTVEEFTTAEVAANSGTAKYDPFDAVLKDLLTRSPKSIGRLRVMRTKGQPLDYAAGIIFTKGDIQNEFSKLPQGKQSVSVQTVTNSMCGIGAVKVDMGKNRIGYCIPCEVDNESFGDVFSAFIHRTFDEIRYAGEGEGVRSPPSYSSATNLTEIDRFYTHPSTPVQKLAYRHFGHVLYFGHPFHTGC